MLRSIWTITLVAALGCGNSEPTTIPSPQADLHDVPITKADVNLPASYAEAMPRINEYRDTIRSAIEAGMPEKAHRPLDELDIVLSELPPIAKSSDIPREQWETINVTSRELRDLFNQLHEAIDERREPDYQAVAEPIDQAITRLKQVTQ